MVNIIREMKSIWINKWNSGKVLLLIGPRQVGKTTFIKELCKEKGDYLFINGDNADDRLILENAGEQKLRSIIGKHTTVFIDEAQRIKDIGLLLKIVHDQLPEIRVLVSGSSALEIANSVNEVLTGRKWEYNLFPLTWNELKKHFGYLQHQKNIPNYLIYGTYPEVITNPLEAEEVLKQISGSYLYKDLLQYQGIRKPEILDKLLLAIALQLGSEVNYNELSRSIGIDRATVEQYISLLEKAFVIFRVQPLARNIRNEINTNRKIYFYDNGIRNAIIGNFKSIELRQDIGALWENFMIAERTKQLSYQKWAGRSYFWRTYQQQEIDWIEEVDGEFSAYEFKWSSKKKNKKMSTTFLKNYPIHKTMFVSPENADEFLKPS
jgi:predicted AAA+ superfamily ATPase